MSQHSQKRPRKLLDQVREAIRRKHYSIRTEEAYASWIKRFILFHNKRHPKVSGYHDLVFRRELLKMKSLCF
jgi:hypothetical protein